MALRDIGIIGQYEGSPRLRLVGPGWALGDAVPPDELIYDSDFGPAWAVIADAEIRTVRDGATHFIPKTANVPTDFVLFMAAADSPGNVWAGDEWNDNGSRNFLAGRWTPRQFHSVNVYDDDGIGIDERRRLTSYFSNHAAFSDEIIGAEPMLRVSISASDPLIIRILGFAALD